MLLIQPMVNEESQPKMVKEFTYASFPNSIAYLACYVMEKNKASVKILDEHIEFLSPERLEQEIRDIQGPKIIGITCVTVTFRRVVELTQLIKKIDSSVLVLIGGIHPTALPEETLYKTAADIVVRGEGEETLSELYRLFQEGKDVNGIQGISCRDNGGYKHNPPRPIIENLEEIPPFPFHLFEKHIDKYKDFGTIFSSRGCPFDCVFCSQRLISGKRYRFLPNHRIMAEIKLLVDKYKQTKIWFIDDNFTINKRRMFALLDDIIASGYHKKVCFIAQTRGKDITWESLVKMKEANFVSIAYGMETGSERLMKLLDKGETVQDNINAVKMTHKAGLLTDASFICGLPTETKEEREMSSKLARTLPLDGARFNVAIPYPGTKFYQIAKKENRICQMEDWSNFSNQHYMQANTIPYAPEGTAKIELIFETLMINLRFTLRPKILFKMLFTSVLSGGGVISLPPRWYFKPRVVVALMMFGWWIMRRYCVIVASLLVYKIKKLFGYQEPIAMKGEDIC